MGFFGYDPQFERMGTSSHLKCPQNGRTIFSFAENRHSATANSILSRATLVCWQMSYLTNGNQLTPIWLGKEDQNSMNPVEQLCFMGQRGMGALEFEPTALSTQNITTQLEMDNLVAVAKEMLHNRKDFTANLAKNKTKL